jgi:hypothetical protein
MAITTSGTSITFNDATTQTTAYTGIPTIIPVGSVMLFYQAAAPTGWTQVTTLNDYDLRLVSGTGGGTGGTTAYSTVFANQTPTITVGSVSVSGTVGSTTLTTSTMPSHTHSTTIPTVIGCGSGLVFGLPQQYTYTSTSFTSASTGLDGAHNHSWSGSGSATASSSAVTLNVRYANIIICSKN